MLKTPLESEAEEHGVPRAKEASSLPHWMDPTRVCLLGSSSFHFSCCKKTDFIKKDACHLS